MNLVIYKNLKSLSLRKKLKVLCEKYEELQDCYNLKKNVGYATKEHLNGIDKHGITNWHRKTFGKCKNCTKIKNII